MRLRYSLLALFAVSGAACGGATSPSYGGNNPPPGGGGGGISGSVSISNTAYSPSSITVKAGATVTWTNMDPVTHSVMSDNVGAFGGDLAGTMPSMDPYSPPTGGGTFQATFSTQGSYAYHCRYHTTMHGTVTVTP